MWIGWVAVYETIFYRPMERIKGAKGLEKEGSETDDLCKSIVESSNPNSKYQRGHFRRRAGIIFRSILAWSEPIPHFLFRPHAHSRQSTVLQDNI